jgi:hypothetical protein
MTDELSRIMFGICLIASALVINCPEWTLRRADFEGSCPRPFGDFFIDIFPTTSFQESVGVNMTSRVIRQT